MFDPMSKIQLLVRSELALFQIQAKRMATQTVFKAVALVFALLALGMLTFAGYQALAVPFGSITAALLVALVHGVLALLLLVISQHIGTNTEQEKMIKEVRELAYKELNKDIDDVKSEVDQITTDVKKLRDNLTTIVSESSALASNIAPILSLLTAALKKNQEKK